MLKLKTCLFYDFNTHIHQTWDFLNKNENNIFYFLLKIFLLRNKKYPTISSDCVDNFANFIKFRYYHFRQGIDEILVTEMHMKYN
jgi:hypothetical protein